MKLLAIIAMTLATGLFPSLQEFNHNHQRQQSGDEAREAARAAREAEREARRASRETERMDQNREGEIREQINRSVPLSSGAQVTIRGINGGVTIETLEGAETAEIDITITASSREALQRRPLLIEEGGNSLTIRTDDRSDGSWRRGDNIHHRVRLRLPRSINLGVNSVNGGLSVGAISGGIAIASVNGRVRVDQAGSATEIKSVNGGVSIALDRLGQSGLTVSSVNGGVELGFGEAVNAQLEVRGVNGSINSEFPLTVQGEVKRGELRGSIGSGGAPITITSVNGGVNLRRR